MLVGWYADAGFKPLIGAGICLCGCADSPTGLGLVTSFHGMQVGMLGACAVSIPASAHETGSAPLRRIVRFLLSSAGMLAGMSGAGWMIGCLRIPDPTAGLFASYLAMSAGMTAGGVIAGRLGRFAGLFPFPFSPARPWLDSTDHRRIDAPAHES